MNKKIALLLIALILVILLLGCVQQPATPTGEAIKPVDKTPSGGKGFKEKIIEDPMFSLDRIENELIQPEFQETIEEYEKFVSSYSEDLVKFIRITGLGKKRIFAIYDHFNIKNFQDLQDIFGKEKESFDFRDNPELDKDTLNPLFLERIQKSIEYFGSFQGKTPRWPVESFSETIMKSISSLEDIERVQSSVTPIKLKTRKALEE